MQPGTAARTLTAALCLGCAACRGAAAPVPSALSIDEQAGAVAAAPVVLHPPAEAFTRAFRLRHQIRLRLPDAAATVLPASCAVAGDGTVYLAVRRRPQIHRWNPARGTVDPLPVAADEQPRDPTALAFEPASGTLHLMDGEGRRFARYGLDGKRLDYAITNAGHSGTGFGVLRGGDLVVGGERRISRDSMTLLAVFRPDGRLRRTFLPISPGVLARREHVLMPVTMDVDEDGGILAGEPTSFVLRRFSAQGDELARFGVAPPGYAAPPPRPVSGPLSDDVEHWLQAWTPLVYVHAGDGLAFAGYEVRRPYHGVQLDVYARDGSRVAAGLLSDAWPTCGAGRTLVFLRRVAADVTELSAYEYVGPAAGAGAAPRAASKAGPAGKESGV
jgi:hypothetical protein